MTSQPEIAVYQTLKRGEWMTSKRVAAEAGIPARTARHHLLRFVRQGIADVSAVWHNYRYRLTTNVPRLEEAARVLDLDPIESVHDSWARR